MCDAESGMGVQVLSVEEDGSYRADEEALRRVAAHAAARGLPVAVVSVAGATRGGKSFLLDFFLRYLRAPEAARRSGAWLGADDEPLTGFSWRGGCDRDTMGITLWSEPIVLTLGSEENSQKVAVLLMDTQGTFDSSSTVRDSSTIFAMSTLLSSVQIYNLSHNIKEDDLQYLQLFTEYGKLAHTEEAGCPFQVLQFLVRDWSYAYQHPLGAVGGQQLLEKRLQIHSEQASELREIRQHVRAAFEEVRGFLLPHPGLTVAASQEFRGCLADISLEFKNALLELVPSLFDPDNITLKKVNGQLITVQDFVEYFKTYVGVFNSDSLPTPMTIMQATVLASLESAVSAAREEYVSCMESSCGGGSYVPRGAPPRLHAAAVDAARAAFAARRTLAAPSLAAARLDALLLELDAQQANYVAVNNAKILASVAACKASYEEAMSCDACLSGAALAARHRAAAAAARDAFEVARRGDPGDVDLEDITTLEKELEGMLPMHRERNEKRIESERAAALEAYAARLRSACDASACVHPAALRASHVAARANASAAFLHAWLDQDSAPAQEHHTNLLNDVDEKFEEFKNENDANNNRVIEEALNVYDRHMSALFTIATICLHPRDLKPEHERASDAANKYFLERRGRSTRSQAGDGYLVNLNRDLYRSFLRFNQKNEERNEDAVKSGHNHYIATIAPIRQGPQGVLEAFGPLDWGVLSRHEPVMNEALLVFRMRRRPGPAYVEDLFLDDLKKKISESYRWLKIKLATSYGIAAVNLGIMAGMFFLKFV